MSLHSLRDRPEKIRRVPDDVVERLLSNISSDVREQLPGYVVRTDRVVPIGLDGDILVVAVDDPNDVEVHERIQFISGRPLRITLASSTALDHAIKVHYPFEDDEES
jgi:hypothetical protein